MEPYACVDLESWPAGRQEEFLYSRGSDRSGVEFWTALDLLRSCQGSRSLDEQARAYATEHELGEQETIGLRAELKRLREAGWLVPANIPTGSERKKPVLSIEDVALPTCARPLEMARGARSVLQQAARAERRIRLLVADDTDDDEQTARNRESLRALAEAFPQMTIRHVTRSEKGKWSAELGERAGVEPSVVQWLTGSDLRQRGSIGGNRTFLLLAQAGRPFVSMDDDVVCDPAMTKGRDDRWVGLLGNEGSFPRRNRSARDENELESWLQLQPELDWLGEHEKALGQKAGDWLATYRKEEIRWTQDAFSWWRRHRAWEGRIALTLTGFAGDCAMPGNHHLLYAGPEKFAQMTASEEAWRSAFTNRLVLESAEAPQLGWGTAFPVSMGLDASQLLPPFPPITYAEDILFFNLLGLSFPERLGLHLPLVLRHQSAARTYRFRAGEDVAPVFWGMLITQWWRSRHGPEGGAESRWAWAAENLADLAASPVKVFRAEMRWQEQQMLAYWLHRLQWRQNSGAPRPEIWEPLVEKCIEQLQNRMESPQCGLATDWAGCEEEEGWTAMQRLTRDYAQALNVWPRLWAAAIEHNQTRLEL
jgi:hypothetical protein